MALERTRMMRVPSYSKGYTVLCLKQRLLRQTDLVGVLVWGKSPDLTEPHYSQL